MKEGAQPDKIGRSHSHARSAHKRVV